MKAAALVATALVALAISLAATGGATVPQPACTPPGPGDHQITVDADRAPVLLHVPPGTVTARRKLILVLPGASMTGRSMAQYTGYSRLADIKGFLVAYPTASGDSPFWNVSGELPGKPDDVGYLRRVIETLTGPAGCADAAHVGVTGVSNGGGMSAHLACEAADVLAAAAPVAGGYSTLPDCEPERPLPILEIHGLRDEVVPYGGKGPHGAGAVGPWIDDWLSRDRCSRMPRSSAPAHNVVELRWTCAEGRIVTHDRVADAEHGWPGGSSLRPFSTTARTWQFLSAFTDEARKPAGGAAVPRRG